MHEEKTPDISVVVPTYNQADLLRENLRSLVDQTLPKDSYEIVVVDDGSTDHTAAVLREFAGPVRTVQLPANRGRMAARNEGIRHALGRLVTFVDSDILVRRDFLAQHLDAYRSHGPGVLSRGPVVLVPDVQTARDSPTPRLTSSPAFLDTANASVERSAPLKAGLFDERFPGYGWEDFTRGTGVSPPSRRCPPPPGAWLSPESPARVPVPAGHLRGGVPARRDPACVRPVPPPRQVQASPDAQQPAEPDATYGLPAECIL